MKISRSARFISPLAVLPWLLAGCDEASARGEHPSSVDSSYPDSSPPDSASPGALGAGNVEDTSQPAPEGLTVRRAALRRVEPASTPPPETAPIDPSLCAADTLIQGRLDSESLHQDNGGADSWVFEAYLVTALSSGPTAIASGVRGLEDALDFAYGFPFGVQEVTVSDGIPTLTQNLIRGTPLPDNALADGRARIDFTVEAGKQYVITFKALFGLRPDRSWDFALSLCSASLKVEGRLQLAEDSDDVVGVEPVSGLLSADNAPPGAIGKLCEGVDIAR